MATDEKVISDQIFWTGLHRVELIRFGKPVDENLWSKKLVPDVSWESLTMFDWIEDPKGLKLHHLYVNWKERGAVDFTRIFGLDQNDFDIVKLGFVPPVVGVLWWIAPGESLSFSADVAATMHKKMFGVMPSTAWVRMIPKNAKDIQVGEGADQGKLVVKTGDWVPERFVVVGNPG